MSMIATIQSDRSVVSIWSWNSSPSRTIGMLPMMMSQPSRTSGSLARDATGQRPEPARR